MKEEVQLRDLTKLVEDLQERVPILSVRIWLSTFCGLCCLHSEAVIQ